MEKKDVEDRINNDISYPFYWYKSEEDILYFLETSEPHFFDQVHPSMSLIKAIDSEHVIGYEIRGAKKILKHIEQGKINDQEVFEEKNKNVGKSLFDEINNFKQGEEY